MSRRMEALRKERIRSQLVAFVIIYDAVLVLGKHDQPDG